MMAWFRATWQRLRSSYWFLPSLMAMAAIALALGSVRFDEDFRYKALRQQGWIYSGGPEGARAVLSTIASSIITVAGTTFSITIAVLSLASAQFGPRLLRNFMRDTGNQIVLGSFTSTFLYCILVLRTVRGLDDDTYVPHISVTVGVALAVLNVGVLIFFIHHIAESIQAGYVIDVAGRELQASVTRLFPQSQGGQQEENGQAFVFTGEYQITSDRDGYLQTVDQEALVGFAARKDLHLKLERRPGDYIVRGMPLAVSSSPIDDRDVEEIRAAFTIGRARTPDQDAVFAFHQLAEIGMRALSPGVNDPFTAITCIDRVTSAMAQLGSLSLPSPVLRDGQGHVRVIAYPFTYEDLVEAGYRHIRESAQGHWQVCRHLRMQLAHARATAMDPRFKAAIEKEMAAAG